MTLKSKLISLALGVFVTLTPGALSQSARTVMVQSNTGVLLFPTNLWSANAGAARSGLSLAPHATNPVVSLASGGTGATNAAEARTNFGLVWAGLTNADAASFRSALSLGTAATNSAAFFQPASAALTNLASNNGAGLTNLSLSNVTGLSAAIDAKLATNGSAAGLTNFPASLLRTNGSAALLTNFPASLLTTNGSAAGLTDFPAYLLTTNGNAAGLTNFPASLLTTNGNAAGLTNIQASAVTGVLNSTNIPSLSISKVTNLQSALDAKLGPTGNAALLTNFPSYLLQTNGDGGGLTNLRATNIVGVIPASNIATVNLSNIGGTLTVASGGTGATNASGARASLELSLPALTNTNNANFLTAFFGSNTNPVLVNTNGSVVSPANFWDSAPILSVFQESTPADNTNTVATNARVLRFQSLAPSINNVTNTVELPTNNVLAGDSATVLHRGSTNSVTTVRQQGSTNSLVSMSRFEEAIRFIYHNGAWRLDNNLSLVEPIYFSGTNAASNAAVSRDSLGLGTNNIPVFTNVSLRGFLGGATLVGFDSGGQPFRYTNLSTIPGTTNFLGNVGPSVTNWTAGPMRTNLGLVLPALTSSNNASFQGAIFSTTNAAPTNTTNRAAWVDLQVGTNTYKLPLYQ